MNLHVVVDFGVVDECEDWLVVDKPAPLIVHPANRCSEPTLLGGVEIFLSYEMENGARPAIVNRLDRETSGLVLVAKHPAAARELGMIFERREAVKEYLAIVHGWPEAPQWECTEPLLRAGDVGRSEIWVRQLAHPEGRPCQTRFEVCRRFEREGRRFALVRCHPRTGRMHQIRVHLQCSGHPIVGDKIYSGTGSEYLEWMVGGWNESLQASLLLPRHALHAAGLSIPWREDVLRWESPLHCDLAEFVEGRKAADRRGVVIWNRSR